MYKCHGTVSATPYRSTDTRTKYNEVQRLLTTTAVVWIAHVHRRTKLVTSAQKANINCTTKVSMDYLAPTGVSEHHSNVHDFFWRGVLHADRFTPARLVVAPNVWVMPWS